METNTHWDTYKVDETGVQKNINTLLSLLAKRFSFCTFLECIFLLSNMNLFTFPHITEMQ